MQLITTKNLERVEISLEPSALQRKQDLLESAGIVQKVTSPATQSVAVDVLRDIKAEIKLTETSRKAVKDPFLQAGQRVDAIANSHTKELELEFFRIQNLIASYQAEELRKQQERDRQLEQEREKLRQQAAEEQKRLQDQVLAARAQEAAQQAEIAQSSLPPSEKAAAATKAIIERQGAEEQAKKDWQALQTSLAQRDLTLVAQIGRTEKPAGLSVQQPWQWDVEDIAKVYAAHPEWCELKIRASAVREAIRQGVRECPGMMIYQGVKAIVRAA